MNRLPGKLDEATTSGLDMSGALSSPERRAGEVCAGTHCAERQVAGARQMYIDRRPGMEFLEQLSAAPVIPDPLALRLLRNRVEECLEPITEGDPTGAERLLAAIARHRRPT